MWKCASKTIKITFHKSILRCTTVLSTKPTQEGDTKRVVNTSPCLIEGFNRFYTSYKNSCGNFHRRKKDREGPREEKTSFLGGFQTNFFDALGWSGVLAIGYFLIHPFTRKNFRLGYEPFEAETFSRLSGYQTTFRYVITSGLKPLHKVVPEVKAAKSIKKIEQLSTSDVLKPEENFSSLEKAHRKVLGALNNWIGAQCMQSGKHKEALEYFKGAAEEDSPAGTFNLGICHEKGLGTRQNFEKAAELYQKAANLGHPTAMYNLGVFYAQGLGGIEPNEDHARELFRAAARLGDRNAKKALIMDGETFDEINSQSTSVLSEKKDNLSVREVTRDNILHQPLTPLSFFTGGAESSSSDNSFEFTKVKDLNLGLSSDSGILDLSPPNEPGVLLA